MKQIISCLAIFIVLVVGCYFWYQWETEPYREDYEKTQQLAREWTASQQPDTHAVIQDATDTAVESETQPAAGHLPDAMNKAEKDTVFDKTSVNLAQRAEVIDKEVRVSPYGFGPYPHIPEGAPIADFEEGDSKDMELLTRVMVKKWNDGERFTGGIIENGKVYLTYNNVVYVEYDEDVNPITGEVFRYISGSMGGGHPITSDEMLSGNISPEFKVVDIDSVGYNPYEVLDLP